MRAINSVGDRFGLPGKIISRVAGAPLLPVEAGGLGTGAVIDGITALEGRSIYLPGIHGDGTIDWEW